MHPSLQAIAQKALYKSELSDGIRYPEYFDESLPESDPDASGDGDHSPTLPLITLALFATAVHVKLLFC